MIYLWNCNFLFCSLNGSFVFILTLALGNSWRWQRCWTHSQPSDNLLGMMVVVTMIDYSPKANKSLRPRYFLWQWNSCLFWACFSLRVGARRMKVRCWSFNLVSKQKFYLKTQQGLPSAVLRLQSTLLSVIWSEHKPLAILHSSPSFAQGPQSESFDFWGLLLSDLISW